MIEQSGATKLSLREVARHAGVSHMAPYSHFHGKAALLCGIAAAGFAMFRRELGRAAGKAASPAEKFVAAGLAYIAFSHKHPQLLGLMFGGVIPPQEHTAELMDARGQAFSDLISVVDAAIRCDQFKPADSKTIALAGWSIAHGFSQLASGGEILEKIGVREDQLLLLARTVLSMLVEGLASGMLREW